MPARRQNQRRHELTAMPHLRHNFKTAPPRQHDVKNDDVERVPGGREQKIERCLAGVDNGDVVAFGFEVEAQALGEMLLVLYYEYAAHLAIGNCSVKRLPL